MEITDPKLKKILEQLDKFDFDFYGFDESGAPLVMGANKQIVEINVAINFVNQQIKEQRDNNSGGSLESPNMNENLDINSSPEHSIETKLEEPDKQVKQKQTQQIKPDQDYKPTVPKINLSQPTIKPYGDGFDPKSFNPSDINSTLKFIEKNSRKSKTSSNAWIAKQFKKFLEEMKSDLN